MANPIRSVLDVVAKKVQRSPLYFEHYNNTLTFSVNRAYEKYAKECAAMYKSAHPNETIGTSAMEKGAATCVRGAVPVSEASAYSAKITDMIEQNHPAVDHPKNYSDLQIRITKPLENIGTGLLDAFKSPKVDKELKEFFKGYYRIEWVNVFRSIPATRVVSSWQWHSDSYPPYSCKAFIHLTPVDAETGATELMNWDDTQAYRRAGYFGQYLDERHKGLDDFAKEHGLNYRPFHFDAAPGDVTIFNMNFFHRAVSPKTKYRDVVQVFLVPNPIPWDEQLKKDGIEHLVHVEGGYRKNPRPTH